ncbi:MAG: hypothetical protein ABJG42_24365 [Vibrio splendidus]
MSTEIEVPTTVEELNRKVLEAISQMGIAHDEGQMSKEAFYQSLTAINLTTLGLIDKDVSDWISTALKENVPACVERRVFSQKGIVVILSRKMGTDSFVMVQNAQNADTRKATTKSFSESDAPLRACTLGFNRLAQQLGEKGFEEIL